MFDTNLRGKYISQHRKCYSVLIGLTMNSSFAYEGGFPCHDCKMAACGSSGLRSVRYKLAICCTLNFFICHFVLIELTMTSFV